MDPNTKGLLFRNKNLQAEEFYRFEELDGKTFDQIALDLWDRLRRKGAGFRLDVEASERSPMRQSAKFSWMPPTAKGYQHINGARGVLDFLHETGAREIYYYFEPIGGVNNPAFVRDVQEIVARPQDFGEWAWSTGGDGLPQLEKVILDKFRRVVHIYIRPVPRYPEAPPQVVTRPPISDQCFRQNGELGWARAGEMGQLVWSEHATSNNPLADLLDELRRKYHIF